MSRYEDALLSDLLSHSYLGEVLRSRYGSKPSLRVSSEDAPSLLVSILRRSNNGLVSMDMWANAHVKAACLFAGEDECTR